MILKAAFTAEITSNPSTVSLKETWFSMDSPEQTHNRCHETPRLARGPAAGPSVAPPDPRVTTRVRKWASGQRKRPQTSRRHCLGVAAPTGAALGRAWAHSWPSWEGRGRADDTLWGVTPCSPSLASPLVEPPSEMPHEPAAQDDPSLPVHIIRSPVSDWSGPRNCAPAARCIPLTPPPSAAGLRHTCYRFCQCLCAVLGPSTSAVSGNGLIGGTAGLFSQDF